MKKLLVVATLLALGVAVYAKVIRSSPEERICEKVEKLCGGEVAKECRGEIDEAEKVLGEEYLDKAADCVDDANSCVEAAGCMVGAAHQLMDEFEKGVRRGADL